MLLRSKIVNMFDFEKHFFLVHQQSIVYRYLGHRTKVKNRTMT